MPPDGCSGTDGFMSDIVTGYTNFIFSRIRSRKL